MTNSEIKKCVIKGHTINQCRFCDAPKIILDEFIDREPVVRCINCLASAPLSTWNRTPEPTKFINNLIKDQKPLPEGISELVDKNFDELIGSQPTKAENGLLRLSNKEVTDYFVDNNFGFWNRHANSYIGGRLPASIESEKFCKTFGTPSITKEQWEECPTIYLKYHQAAMLFKPKNEITKEQLLAILPEKKECFSLGSKCDCEAHNACREIMKQRIEDAFK